MNIISLGAGVQSSALLLMALHGEFDWQPDCAIFADTGAEPDAVYQHLDYLESIVGDAFPVHRVTVGNIETDILDAVAGNRTQISQPPFFVKNLQTKEGMPPVSGGMIWRKCTQWYKLTAIRRKVAGLRKSSGQKRITQYIGISLDEFQRMKDSGVKYITNKYPLVDLRMTRHDCLLWLSRNGYRLPGKSACHFCPYRSAKGWADMKRDDPLTFARAVRFDERLREGKLPGVTGDAYVFRGFVPLAMADFSKFEDNGQGDLFDQECEGMCGV